MKNRIEIIGVEHIPDISEGVELGEVIVDSLRKMGFELRDGDIIVISHIIVSKAEGRTVDLSSIKPSEFALKIAKESSKDPRYVELVLRESKRIVRMRRGLIISETVGGLVCANAGVDLSNAGIGRAALLPIDPDYSARKIREKIKKLIGVDVAVIISDTHGRPLRSGAVNIAIGCSGIEPLFDRRGEKDLYGRELTSKIICIADELASAAELVIGQADEGVPVAIIRGYRYQSSETPATVIPRREEDDLFL
ncbi:MAG: coenzyme F420-0:L-glutamate ligase [Aigarchaeota archaeon]|nr:coenzyme F420-0:L-glutamate ligase [Aigarchaeota archaeon]MCX8192952.1 coenzyme F420-0:L-glutamate ligase [Nitrososphaeria archaeon]MDW7986403.1 coenzyme F420-0:L-glutamate ligase [Nitrososphaerota archaeon]